MRLRHRVHLLADAILSSLTIALSRTTVPIEVDINKKEAHARSGAEDAHTQ